MYRVVSFKTFVSLWACFMNVCVCVASKCKCVVNNKVAGKKASE